MECEIIPVFCNEKNMANYAYIVCDKNRNTIIVIDAAEASPVIRTLEKQALRPTHILTTHHHFDHVEGNLSLKERYGLKIVAPEKEFTQIPGADIPAREGTTLTVGSLNFSVIGAPGHTLGHVLYHLPDEKKLFTGDTLFNLCIGGLFEGTPKQMFASLKKIKSLPEETEIFPGHEYTRAALPCDSAADNKNNILWNGYLQKMYRRERGILAPATLKEEKLFNPYMQTAATESF